MIEKLLCKQCGRIVGATDTETGESEYERGMRDGPYCKECYDDLFLQDLPYMAGFDDDDVPIEFEEDYDDEEDLLYEE